MKAKTTVNFTDSQLATLRSMLSSIGWASSVEGSHYKVEFYRTSEDAELAKELANLLDRADTVALTTEGDLKR